MTIETSEENLCTCGAGHGSLEGHMAWCAWLDEQPKMYPTGWAQHLDGSLCTPEEETKTRASHDVVLNAVFKNTVGGVWPDFIAPPMYGNAAEGWTDPALPDFRLIWKVAREHGYAVGLHGSMKRDCDLVAVPWVEAYATPQVLIDALCESLDATEVGPREPKPNGRIAVNLQINGWFRIIDLSILGSM